MRLVEPNILKTADTETALLPHAPRDDWRAMAKTEHFVQFYEADGFLIDSVSQFIGAALGSGGGAVVLATAEHRLALDARMREHGLDVAGLLERGQLVVMDAAETLAKIMVNTTPDPKLFKDTLAPVLARFEKERRAISAFGEMVALLWADGNGKAAIRLEELWNDLATAHAFSLFCAYPINGFRDQVDGQSFTHICDKHTRVIPAESYTCEPQTDERLRSISQLQQKAVALNAETKARERAELLVREQQTKMLIAANLANLATWDLNLETYAIDASKEFKNLLGLEASQGLDYQGLLLLIHPSQRRRVSNALHTALANNLDYNVEYRLLDANGTERWLMVMGRYFKDPFSQRMLCVAREMTPNQVKRQSSGGAFGDVITH